jgi:hypothetical protein
LFFICRQRREVKRHDRLNTKSSYHLRPWIAIPKGFQFGSEDVPLSLKKNDKFLLLISFRVCELIVITGKQNAK